MTQNKKNVLSNQQLMEIEKIIADIKFGSVTLIIQDGVLIQIEKNEKLRLK